MKFVNKSFLFLSIIFLKNIISGIYCFEIEKSLLESLNYSTDLKTKHISESFDKDSQQIDFQLNGDNFKFTTSCLYNDNKLCDKINSVLTKTIDKLSNTFGKNKIK